MRRRLKGVAGVGLKGLCAILTSGADLFVRAVWRCHGAP
jgi:hypothetical protein